MPCPVCSAPLEYRETYRGLIARRIVRIDESVDPVLVVVELEEKYDEVQESIDQWVACSSPTCPYERGDVTWTTD